MSDHKPHTDPVAHATLRELAGLRIAVTGKYLNEVADRIADLEGKLDGAVSFRHRPESDEWQADFGDHHAVGKTKERAIFELGMYLMRREAK